LDVVGDFESVEESLAGIRDLQPDVVLTDLALRGLSGIDLVGEVNRISPLTRTIVLTAHDNIQYVSAAWARARRLRSEECQRRRTDAGDSRRVHGPAFSVQGDHRQNAG